MPLTGGAKLGPYEIKSALAKGGMGEVYSAIDTRLDRVVAIKVLTGDLTENQEAKRRFEREARAISALSHPNICALYDVGHQDGIDYLVMEFLEGETLANRLTRGPLTTAHVLKYGIEICEGLERAHHSGIVHRDLKPGNIMLTKSAAKLMDFGLAKTFVKDPASSVTLPLSALVGNHPVTTQGTVIGTFHYLSPEQAEGKGADARSDIFSYGAVLYEMATGRRAFEGQTAASVIAAVLNRDPPHVSTVQPQSPVALDRVVQVCLAKDPDERFQSVHDVKLQLKWISESGPEACLHGAVALKRRNREMLAWALAAGFAVLGATFGLWTYRHQAPVGADAVLASIPPPPDTHFLGAGPSEGPAVVSPDGSKLAFTAVDHNGQIQTWTRSLQANDPKPVPGAEDGMRPFWSPDSRSLGFFAGGSLKTVDLTTGNVMTLAVGVGPGAWSPGGVILFRPNRQSEYFRISASGNDAVSLGKMGPNDFYQVGPAFLPDGEHFLIVIGEKKTEHQRVELRSLQSSASKLVLEDASFPTYSDGFLLFLRNARVMVQQFDPNSGKVSGTAAPIAHAITYSIGGHSVLAFQYTPTQGRLEWFDLQGNPAGVIGEAADYEAPRISPDGKRVSVGVYGSAFDLWSIPATGGVPTRMTFGPGYKTPGVWSPDARYVAYCKYESAGKISLVRKPSDGTGAEETLLTFGPDIALVLPQDWSPDGHYISYHTRISAPEFRQTLWILPLLGNRRPFKVTSLQARLTGGNFSPDGHWLAYSSDETGQHELYVVPFPGSGEKFQISHGGGWGARWDKKGELFYQSTGNQLMKADLILGAQSPQVKSLGRLFGLNLAYYSTFQMFDVPLNGHRILVLTPARPESAYINLLINWRALLSKK